MFTMNLVALPILSAVIGLAAFLLIVGNEGVRGQNLALLGMGMGVAFGFGSYISTVKRDHYFYEEGGKIAEEFMKIVSQNKLLQAYELTRSEAERQVAGTSLEEAYENATSAAKENIDAFKNLEGIVRVVSIGPSAQWKYVSGEAVRPAGGTAVHVLVKMVDENSQKTATVTLNRAFQAGVGAWFVVSVK